MYDVYYTYLSITEKPSENKMYHFYLKVQYVNMNCFYDILFNIISTHTTYKVVVICILFGKMSTITIIAKACKSLWS